MKSERRFHNFWVLGLILLLFVLASCAKKHPTPMSVEDNPVHHYLQGMVAIEKGKIKEADSRFDRAIYLDKDYSPAYSGKALVMAIIAGKEKDEQHREVDMKRVKEYLSKADDKAKDDTEKFIFHVTAIRAYTEAHPKDWLDKAKDHYNSAISLDEVDEKGLPYYRTRSAADYFMGIAYYRAYKFKEAQDLLSKVLSSKPSKWHDPADTLYKKVQKIVRASAEYTLTDVAKEIAVKDKVTRADVAALLVDELHLEKLFSGRIPVKSQLPKADFVPADVLHHPFRAEIITVMKWHIRGLEPEYDKLTKAYLFKPQEYLKRKELAFILEDLLIKITGDESISRAYFGSTKSPFPDVPVNVAWFNAVMNVTTRGLMEADLSGEFRPDDYVDGADLILAVMKLRNIINIY